jgi:hypothetical protein
MLAGAKPSRIQSMLGANARVTSSECFSGSVAGAPAAGRGLVAIGVRLGRGFVGFDGGIRELKILNFLACSEDRTLATYNIYI